MMRTLIAAVRFLTRVPVPGRPTESADLPGSIAWFPLVGAAVGAAIGGLGLLAAMLWNPGIAAVIAVAGGLVLTGGFHEDAASDAADGLGGGFTTEKVLLIMRDSRIGAYGAMSLWVVLSLRAVAVATLLGWVAAGRLPAWQVPVILALAATWGRWTAAPLLWLPPLSDGLAKDVAATRQWWPTVVATGLAVAATTAATLAGVAGCVVASFIGCIACGLWATYLWRRLRGQSGDLLGAGNQLVEGAVILTLLATNP